MIASNNLGIRFENKKVRAAVKAGDEHAARIAQRQLDTLHEMRDLRDRPDCTPGRQQFINEALEALTSVSSLSAVLLRRILRTRAPRRSCRAAGGLIVLGQATPSRSHYQSMIQGVTVRTADPSIGCAPETMR